MVSETGDMGCTGVTGWLDGDAAAYVISGDSLIIEAADGEDLTVLTRSD